MCAAMNSRADFCIFAYFVPASRSSLHSTLDAFTYVDAEDGGLHSGDI